MRGTVAAQKISRKVDHLQCGLRAERLEQSFQAGIANLHIAEVQRYKASMPQGRQLAQDLRADGQHASRALDAGSEHYDHLAQ